MVYLVYDIFYNADEGSCSNSQTYEQQDVKLSVVLSRGSIRSLYEDPWISVKKRKKEKEKKKGFTDI